MRSSNQSDEPNDWNDAKKQVKVFIANCHENIDGGGFVADGVGGDFKYDDRNFVYKGGYCYDIRTLATMLDAMHILIALTFVLCL